MSLITMTPRYNKIGSQPLIHRALKIISTKSIGLRRFYEVKDLYRWWCASALYGGYNNGSGSWKKPGERVAWGKGVKPFYPV